MHLYWTCQQNATTQHIFAAKISSVEIKQPVFVNVCVSGCKYEPESKCLLLHTYILDILDWTDVYNGKLLGRQDLFLETKYTYCDMLRITKNLFFIYIMAIIFIIDIFFI